MVFCQNKNKLLIKKVSCTFNEELGNLSLTITQPDNLLNIDIHIHPNTTVTDVFVSFSFIHLGRLSKKKMEIPK